MGEYRNCNDEVVVKILGKLTIEMPILEVDVQKQLQIRRLIEETLYDYEVTTKETALVTSDLEGKINYFLATKKLEGLSPKTLRNYKYNLNKLTLFFNKPASTITSADIKMFMYANMEGKQENSLNSFMTPIRKFFSFLQNEEFIIKNPCESVKPVKEPKRVRPALTQEQVEIIRDKLTTYREKALFEFFLSTGCRLGEAREVKISDVDFNAKTLLVIGKGDKQRRVYFTERCKLALQNYLKSRTDNDEYLFVGERKPFKQLSSRGIERAVDKMKEKSGLDIKVFPHLFRHTMATGAVNSGMRIEVVQQILGHEQISTSLIYAKMNQSTIEYDYRRLVS